MEQIHEEETWPRNPSLSVRRAASFPPLLLPLLVAAASASAPASAQTPPAADATTPATTAQPLEAITVTGTRRREPVRDVPVQLSTLPAEELERSGARTLMGLPGHAARHQPQHGGRPRLGNAHDPRRLHRRPDDPHVGVYVDDVPFGTSSAYAFPVALDMGCSTWPASRSCAGPKATIYGASTMGGLIKYVTNEPDTTRFGGRAMASFGSTQHGGTNNTLSAVLNVPLQEQTAGVRLAAFRDHFGGYVDATGRQRAATVNSGDTVGGRASLVVGSHEPAAHQAERDLAEPEARQPGRGGLRRGHRQSGERAALEAPGGARALFGEDQRRRRRDRVRHEVGAPGLDHLRRDDST
jgi:outer membrane receptor protein involved in Fe transport